MAKDTTRAAPSASAAALTTRAAADYCGLTNNAFTTAMSRARGRGLDLRIPAKDWIDARTPLWDAARLADWQAQREEAAATRHQH